MADELRQPVDPRRTLREIDAFPRGVVVAMPGAWPDELPLPAHRLIGRDAALRDLERLFQQAHVRLVTLMGMGGIGKTRLAMEVAVRVSSAFRDGVRFVDLTRVRDERGVLAELCTAFALRQLGRRSPMDALTRALRGRNLLLILDNLEQIVSAAPLFGELLAVCPELRILATSRVRLHLQWEHEVLVEPLSLPTAEEVSSIPALLNCPSVALLLDRLGTPGPSRTDDDVRVLGEVCRRLDGIPLAIELAAARAKVLPPRALLARLREPLDLLSSNSRDSPDRHQTLRRTFDWSYDLLQEDDRVLFERLGLFLGGCRIDAVHRIAAPIGVRESEVIASLSRLVDSSLLRSQGQDLDGEPRFALLEPVREYAVERLRARGDVSIISSRHAQFYLDLAEIADPQLGGPEQSAWLARLDGEHGNLQAALRWFIDSAEYGFALRLAGALARFWWLRCNARDGFVRLTEVLAVSEHLASTSVRARAMIGAGVLAYHLSEFARAEALLSEAIAALRQLAEDGGIGLALVWLGNCALAQGRLAVAQQYYEESQAHFTAAHDARGVALTALDLGLVAFQRGQLDLAYTLLSESIAVEQSLGDTRGIALGLGALGLTRAYRGELEAGADNLRQSVTLARDCGELAYLPLILEAFAMMTVAAGDPRRGLRIGAGATALRTELDAPRPPVWGPAVEEWLMRARTELAASDADDAWESGLRLSSAEVIEEALAFELPAPPRATRTRGEEPNGLTAREAEVLRLVAGGASNKEIARGLSISVATVERHIATVYGKINARNRVDATNFAIRHNFLR